MIGVWMGAWAEASAECGKPVIIGGLGLRHRPWMTA
jgi:hypothetical protein